MRVLEEEAIDSWCFSGGRSASVVLGGCGGPAGWSEWRGSGGEDTEIGSSDGGRRSVRKGIAPLKVGVWNKNWGGLKGRHGYGGICCVCCGLVRRWSGIGDEVEWMSDWLVRLRWRPTMRTRKYLRRASSCLLELKDGG